MSPRLSIILTSHNRGKLLRQAIQSVFDQTFRNWELIVVDDDSTDPEVLKILDELRTLCNHGTLRLHVIVSSRGSLGNGAENPSGEPGEGKNASEVPPKNVLPGSPAFLFKRVAFSINRGLDLAQGDFISYLCDDDLYFPDRCAKYLEAFDDSTDVVVGNAVFVSPDGARKHQNRFQYQYPASSEKAHFDLIRCISTRNSFGNFICHDSAVHRATALRWPIDVTPVPNDWRFWLQLFEHGHRFKKIEYVGEEAVFPGSWKSGLTQELVLSHRVMRRTSMIKGRYAINSSGKKQNVSNGTGVAVCVVPNERVNADWVTYTDAQGHKCLYPGFTIDGEFEFPEATLNLKVPTPVITQHKQEMIPEPEIEPDTPPEPDPGELSKLEIEESIRINSPAAFEPIDEMKESPLTRQNAEPKHPFDI